MLIAQNGHYYEDPRALAIHSYVNDWGNVTYHVAYDYPDVVSLMKSPHCHDIKLLWLRDQVVKAKA